MIAQTMAGGDMQQKLNWLQPRPMDKSGRFDDASARTLAAFGIRPEDVK